MQILHRLGMWMMLTMVITISLLGFSSAQNNRAPDPSRDFFKKMQSSYDGGAGVYNPSALGVESDKTFKQNIRNMFYPGIGGSDNENILWTVVRNIAGAIFLIFIVMIGLKFMMNADEEGELGKAKSSFLYLMYGGFMVFGSIWILRQLNIGGVTGAQDLVLAVKDNLLFNFISFIKASAFFVAIIMIIYYGLQIIRAYEKEDKLKEARTGIVNVLGLLMLIKVIDYLYFIAYDDGFKTKAVDFIVTVSKLLGRAIGVISVIYVIYAGFMLVMGQGESERLKKATNVIKAIFFAVLIIFLFLLTMYQLFNDLG